MGSRERSLSRPVSTEQHQREALAVCRDHRLLLAAGFLTGPSQRLWPDLAREEAMRIETGGLMMLKRAEPPPWRALASPED